MPHFTIESPPVAGFVVRDTPAGGTVPVITKAPLVTSDQPQFHLWMRQITGLFLSKIPFPPFAIEHALILIHANGSADVYVNDFQAPAKMKVNRAVAAGEAVALNDVTDIVEVKFPTSRSKPMTASSIASALSGDSVSTSISVVQSFPARSLAPSFARRFSSLDSRPVLTIQNGAERVEPDAGYMGWLLYRK